MILIPTIHYVADQYQKVEGHLIPTMYIRSAIPLGDPSTLGPLEYDIQPSDEVPGSFAQGMREIEEGHAIDFDKALRERPPVE